MPKFNPLKFNDFAPDVELRTGESRPVRLSSLWKDKPLVLAFTRHFGCPQCKEMLHQLVEHLPELAAKNLSLAVITQAPPDATQAFCTAYAPGILCLSDQQREAYTAYGLGTGTLRQTFLSASVWKSNRKLEQERGWKTELPPQGQDAMLMSATFIIGRDGRIRMPYYYDDIADHPPVDLLLKGIMGMDWDTPLESPIKPEDR